MDTVDKPRMSESGVSSGEREAASRKRLAVAGYAIAADEPLKLVHCSPGAR